MVLQRHFKNAPIEYQYLVFQTIQKLFKMGNFCSKMDCSLTFRLNGAAK